MDLKKLREKREKKGISIAEAARAVGATWVTIWRWENVSAPEKMTSKFRKYLELIGGENA